MTAIERLAELEKAGGSAAEKTELRKQIEKEWKEGGLSLGMDEEIAGLNRERNLGYLLLEQYAVERGMLEAGSWKDYFEAGEEPTEEEFRTNAEAYYYAGVNFLKNA